MNEKDTYRIFDNSEDEYVVRPATNANIREILTVPTQAIHKTNEERIYYAQEADLPPVSTSEDGHPVYTFLNLYMPANFWAALAQQLFFGCPEMIRVKDDSPVIVRQEHYDNLNREEVRRAFNTFLGKFACTPFEVRSLLNSWDSAQISGIMEKLKEAGQRHGNMPPTSTLGEEKS